VTKNKKPSERIVSVRRHTIGYVIDGVEHTRREVIDLVKKAKVKNVKVVDNRHLVGDGFRLYDLPTRFGTHRRFAALRSR
jgi:hypothetical protein